MNRKSITQFVSALASAAALALSAQASAATVYASYNGSQQGVTVRDLDLNQTFYFGTPFNINAIAAGGNNDVYLASGNHLYNYSANGVEQLNMTFPDAGVNYSSVAFGGDKLYASYTGSQQGVTVRDLNLNQTHYFSTGFNINGIAAGGNNDVYLASGNHLYNYSANGDLLLDMTFPDGGINYTDVAFAGDKVFASYAGSQQGVTVRDLSLNQTYYFSTDFDINGIAAGHDNDIFLSSGNRLYRYSTNGSLISSMTFPDGGINYTDITITPVPEPETYAMMLAGLAAVGVASRRRARKSK